MKLFFKCGGSLFLSILLVGCNGAKEEPVSDSAVPVKVIEIESAEALSHHDFIGTVEESFASSLSFSISGNVEQVFVSEGDPVKKGQILAKLDEKVMQNAYNAAKASSVQAQDAFNRLTSLHEKGSLPEIKYVEVQTQLEQAKSMEQIAGKNLKDCSLYAPFSGVIAQRSADIGINVLPGVQVFKLSKIETVDIKISVPENEISSIMIGQPVRIRVSALENQEFAGKITEKGIQANPLSHAYDVKINLHNPQSKLMPGMVCNVMLTPANRLNGILVPNSAIQIEHTGKRFVWVASKGMAARCYVETGEMTNDGVVVSGQFAEDGKIIVEGMQKISEGMKIEIK
ncbi:MAG: efflux RND transporter periplasmic adaptor subunit [Porphyromonadaceae bacterium]|nr:efflux RND transporter periplasmic adaptor subunit [Porphyromonadaceae bacterium]